jgi:hypothetical protein
MLNDIICFVREKYQTKLRWWRIDNWLALIGASLGFLGSIVVLIDRYPPTQSWINSWDKWKNLEIAIQKTNADGVPSGTYYSDYIAKNIGLQPTDPGFNDLISIVKLNFPKFSDKEILFIFSKSVMGIGENIETRVISAMVREGSSNNFNSQSIALKTTVVEWINVYRQRFFLTYGFILTAVGFFFGILSRIRTAKPKEHS